jgi:hypothetical protein
MAFSFLRFLDHTQRRTTFGRTPLDEWSALRRNPKHNNHNRQTSMPLGGFEPSISADERPQTYALDRAATGIGSLLLHPLQFRRTWCTLVDRRLYRCSQFGNITDIWIILGGAVILTGMGMCFFKGNRYQGYKDCSLDKFNAGRIIWPVSSLRYPFNRRLCIFQWAG